MFEIHVGELRATFLRNHNMRHHNDPTKCPKPGRQLKPRRPPQPRQSPQPPQARGRCTRYVALHPLRGGAPEQKRCIAYGSGALPQHTRTNAELAHRTTHRRTPPCAAGPYWRQDGHAAHAATCTPAHPGPLRHPYMRRARLVEGQRRGRLGFALAQCGQADQHQDDHRPARTGHGEEAAACADRVDRGSGDRRAERGAQVDRG